MTTTTTDALPARAERVAQRVAAQIRQNVADETSGRIDWAEFSRRQRAAWSRAEERGERCVVRACRLLDAARSV